MSWQIPDPPVALSPAVGVGTGQPLDTTVAQLLTAASELPPAQVRPTAELVRVTDGVVRILFTQIDGRRDYNDDGDNGITPATFQVDYYAPRLSTARSLADKVRRTLDGYSGADVVRIHFPSERFGQATRDQGANNTTARVTHDVVVTYREQT